MGSDAGASVSATVALRLGDTCLVLAQRLSEWCGHAPILEEDIALANIALDVLGHARGLLTRAGELEGNGRDEDDLAFLRDATEFTNVRLVELRNGDFGRTLLRQLFYDAYAVQQWAALQYSRDEVLAGIAAKAATESAYHLRHSAGWVVRLGDGTPESHDRMVEALEFLWPYTAELFHDDGHDETAAVQGIVAAPSSFAADWHDVVGGVLREGNLPAKDPAPAFFPPGGRQGRHTEHLDYLLAPMQVVHRAHPGVRW